MKETHDPHATYDELASPQELRDDCEALKTNMPFLQRLSALQVPAQRLYDPVAVKKMAAKPVMAVSAAATKMGERINPFSD